ncbi:MAG TPA: TonB family protein [Bryobacteraceae bacterium]|nr:TonB family protein [Bryobacteraceae bacterium]
MKSLADPPVSATPEPDFLRHLNRPPERRSLARSTVVSVVIHLVGVLALLNTRFEAPPLRHRRMPQIVHHVTPLIAPNLTDLTQKAPNTKAVSKEIDLQSLVQRKEVKAPPAKAAASPQPRPGIPAPSALPDAPQITPPAPQLAQLPPQGTGVTNQPPPPPQIQQPPEKPKLAFESIAGAGKSTGNVNGGATAPRLAIPVPKNTIEDAVARASRRPGGGLVVGDDAEPQPTIGESLSQRATPGKMGSSLELLSDPQGVDFRSYLVKVLAAVRRNWFAVMPESAHMGRSGKVQIQFVIGRDGNVPKLVIALPSGAEPLDRAAVAGISASNPFPPLPEEFRGGTIRLQLSFVYNGRR